MLERSEELTRIEKRIMCGLKDFQRATVERIDYLYRNGQNRILVSDEVGLGKTLVAKGVVAKFAKLRHEENDNLVKVIYICSNSAIVDQNLNKLKIIDELEPESSYTSRLSMQHLNIFKQEYDKNVLEKYIQLIPLTPETSFNVSNSQGTVHERALMFAILKRIDELDDYQKELEEIFRFDVKYWEDIKNDWDIQVDECDENSNGEYVKYMIRKLWGDEDSKKDSDSNEDHDSKENQNSKEMHKLIKLCEKVRKKGFDKQEVKPYIVTFRNIFAQISLDKLEPDLIIMDEFQRFRHLLKCDEGSEMEKLTSKFFNSEDTRILMLSATPYKMYSTLEEISEEDIDAHYSEFFELINFLKESENEQEKFKEIWNDYSVSLKEWNNDKNSFIIAKTKAQDELFENMCRTERISEKHLMDIVDTKDVNNPISILNEDILSYIEVQDLLDKIKLKINVPIDYIKSTPYIMSFMNNYQLKIKIKNYFEEHIEDIDKMKKDTFWLNESDIDNYAKISNNNARLNNLMENILKNNESHLLWVPPSISYYELGGVFKNQDNFSKNLIFSSWEMVPRMISSLVSYEAERQTIGQLNRNIRYYQSKDDGSSSRSPSPRLRFSTRTENRYNVSKRSSALMPLLTLIYPSIFLIDSYNPIDCLNRGLSISEIEKEIKTKIKNSLDNLQSVEEGYEDSRWYNLAPLFLDEDCHVKEWFNQLNEFEYVNKVQEQYDEFNLNTMELGRKPNDLIDVLCDMAIASPAICAYRSYEKELPQNSLMKKYLINSSQIGRRFVNYFNLPESIAVIDLNFNTNSRYPYWKNVLKYSKDGNLQAVFDEYVHILANGLDRNNLNRIDIIHKNFLNAFEFRTTSYDIDTFNDFKSKIKNEDSDEHNYLRTHYAASFTKGRSDESDSNRKKSVINAFNSPFRPFVIASTSIGQEGLDFHNYCRKIVHWNLPSNPVDLEQREGRINRFESLVIRKNVAERYGNNEFKTNVWKELFDIASNYEKVEGCSDLIPHWGLTESENMIKIERIVPMYPFSSDEIKYDRLIRILSLYRLTLGQPRQEELLESMFYDCDFEDINLEELFINLSPYYKDDVENFEIDCED